MPMNMPTPAICTRTLVPGVRRCPRRARCNGSCGIPTRTCSRRGEHLFGWPAARRVEACSATPADTAAAQDRRVLPYEDTHASFSAMTSLMALPAAVPRLVRRGLGGDWCHRLAKLLAAIGYQGESKWDRTRPIPHRRVRRDDAHVETPPHSAGCRPEAASDARESILAGAPQYFQEVLGQGAEAHIPEPDRTWLAIAAYNVGYEHVEDARRPRADARQESPDSWPDAATCGDAVARSMRPAV